MLSTSELVHRFTLWQKEAVEHAGEEASIAATLATASREGRPSARIVLVRAATTSGFYFYTNYQSRKGRELTENPHAALCFYWPSIGRQVRVEGDVETLPEAESDAYFVGRPHISQLGAWASHQSEPLPNREALMQSLESVRQRFGDVSPVPRPPHWGGFRLVPSAIEFWQEGKHRLHDRELYAREAGGLWRLTRLNP